MHVDGIDANGRPYGPYSIADDAIFLEDFDVADWERQEEEAAEDHAATLSRGRTPN